MIKINLIPSN